MSDTRRTGTSLNCDFTTTETCSTEYVQVRLWGHLACPECERRLIAQSDGLLVHPPFNSVTDGYECEHAGKQFKPPTIPLEVVWSPVKTVSHPYKNASRNNDHRLYDAMAMEVVRKIMFKGENMNSKKLKDIKVEVCELGIEDTRLLVKIRKLEIEREEINLKIRTLQCEAEKETQV